MTRKNFIERLNELATKRPNKIAVEYKDKTITYKEFNDITDNISNNIVEYTQGRNEIIPIRIEDELNSILIIYGILKANCAYLPLPKEITAVKCEDILSEVKPIFYVTDFDYDLYNKQNIYFNKLLEKSSSKNNNLEYKCDNLLYIIYTSGTTGKPKGCMLEDRSVFYRLNTLDTMFPFTEDSKYLLSTNYSFDVSVTEIFGWVFGGGSVLIFDKSMSSHMIPKLIYDRAVTHSAFAPSILKILFHDESISYFKNLKYLFLAGEKLDIDIAKKLQKFIPNVDVYNLYGPTEASVYCTSFRISELTEDYKSVPIGKPLNGVTTKVDFLNDSDVGELLIGGVGLARGYYNDDELTAQKFIVYDNERYYRSGDLVSLDNNQYMFHGRIDNQIKINGVRVETEEIERALKEVFDITGVVIRHESFLDKKILVAYIETEGKQIDYTNAKNKLEKIIEKYFIPKYFIEVDKFHLNKNNKIDTNMLKDLFLEQINSSKSQIQLNDELDIILYETWRDILKVEFSQDDDFFMIGGDSLDLIMLVSDLEKKLNIIIPTVELSKSSTFSEQKDLINNILSKNDANNFLEFWLNELDFDIQIYTENNENIIKVISQQQKEYIINKAKNVSKNLKPDRILINEYSFEVEDIKIKLPFKAVDLNEVDTFPLFSRQEFYIRKNFIQYLSKNVELKSDSTEEILNTINELIKIQLLLRVVIKNNVFVEKDLKCISVDDVQFFDLSNCTYEDYISNKNKINNEVIASLKEIPLHNNFMYEIIIFKKNLNTHEVVFVIDHNIVDAHGLSTLETLLIDIHYKKPFELNNYNYKDFVQDVIITNNDETIVKLTESDYYKQLYRNTKNFNESFNLQNITQVYEFEFENPSRDKTDRANFVFNKISEIVEQQTGQTMQSYQILKNLNSFNSKDYKNQIGDFHVSIFVPFNTHCEKDLYSKSELLLEEIYLQKNWHLDYLCSSNAYQDNVNTQIFQEVSLNINYLGELVEKDLNDFRIETLKLMETLKNLHQSKVRITCFNVGDKSYIYILNGMQFDEQFKLTI